LCITVGLKPQATSEWYWDQAGKRGRDPSARW